MSRTMITRTWAAADGSTRVVLGLHRKAPPSDEEWLEYLAAIAAAFTASAGDPTRVRGLSITDGGGPDAKQRDQLKALLKKQSRSRGIVAIVTADPIGRGIIKALSWFNPDTRGFHPQELPAALDYLSLTADQRADFAQTLDAALIEYPIESVEARRFELPKSRSSNAKR